MREAWQTYTPTGFSSQPLDRPLPAEDRIAAEYQSTLVTLVEREIAPQVEELEARISRRSSPRLINRLGTLYARFGLYEQAIETFQRANTERPDDPEGRLGLARTFFELSQYGPASAAADRNQVIWEDD